MIQSLGPVCWILLALGLVSLVVFFERFVELRRSRIDYEDFVKGIVNLLDGGKDEEALAICEETDVPVARIVSAAIRHRHGFARDLRNAVDAAGRAETGRLDRRLAVLAIIGQISPLVGLLGTVIGFYTAVRGVQAAEVIARADLIDLSMGALSSAALGLAVAIPVAVMYGILRVRLDRIVVELGAAASLIVNYISAKEAQK